MNKLAHEVEFVQKQVAYCLHKADEAQDEQQRSKWQREAANYQKWLDELARLAPLVGKE